MLFDNDLVLFEAAINSDATLITTDIIDKLLKVIEEQLALMENGKTPVNPNFLEVLDLEVFMSL